MATFCLIDSVGVSRLTNSFQSAELRIRSPILGRLNLLFMPVLTGTLVIHVGAGVFLRHMKL